MTLRADRDPLDVVACLTARQRQILSLVLKGASDNVMARQLDMNAHTVQSHMKSIDQAADVSSWGELMAIFARGTSSN
jgi:DNA-binding CsgD family transcriptional regulator